MIIHNEADRMKAWALLRDAELPCNLQIERISKEAKRIGDLIVELEKDEKNKELLDEARKWVRDTYYTDTPEPTLGDHTSGEEHY